MAYNYKAAIKTAYKYLCLDEDKVKIIENTNGRGIVYEFDGIKMAIFIYPISCKQNNKQNFFDTRDSGAKERAAAWKYAKENDLKYFCLGFNEEQERYKEYVISLESDENSISNISFRKANDSEATGTQVNIPNDFIPKEKFERIRTPKGFYISAIQKEHIWDYMKLFDNRPYETIVDKRNTEDVGVVGDRKKVVYETRVKKEYSNNRIIFGAPGTGKSFRINRDKDSLLEDGGEFERVTFHANYSYANFVGTYKPVMAQAGEISYEYVPGPFMRVLAKALESAMSENPKPYVLIIEEINRANAAAVFGDVFQLLDRNGNGVSEYSISTSQDMRTYLAQKLGVDESDVETIKIPDNMFIWATMNSADQGVFPMDTAFKRRWDFEYIGIDEEEKEVVSYVIPIGNTDNRKYIYWNDLRKAINNKLSSEECKVNEDKLLGPFFISKSALETALENEEKFVKSFESKVLMYLFEDAMKMSPKKIFEGHAKNGGRMIFSEICKAFREDGIEIFGFDTNMYVLRP